MPLDPSIYQQMQPNLAGQLAGSLNQFTEQRARLSDLAQQRDIQQQQMQQQAVTQGYQNRALQRAEEAIPAQQAEAQRKAQEEARKKVAAYLIPELRAKRPMNEVAPMALQLGRMAGDSDEVIMQNLSSIYSDPNKLEYHAQRLQEHLFPEETYKAQLEAQKPKAQSDFAKLISELEAATGRKLTAQEVNSIYQDAIKLKTTKPEPLVQVQLPTGEIVYKPQSAAAGMAVPQKAGKEVQLSATAQKELFEADETIQASSNVIGLLEQAKALNKKAYSGYGAKQRAIARSNLPGASEEADATINLDNIMTSQALESLKAIFGGMPTEGERKILMDIQASVDKTPAQRETIMDRAKTAVQNRIKFSTEKANKLRAGEYFKPTQQAEQPTPQSSGVKFLGFE